MNEIQLDYINKVKNKILEIFPNPRAYVKTYGCQQNVSDSEKYKGFLELMGFDFTEDPQDADLILYNTCAIRAHAEDKVLGNLGALKNLKQKKPNLIITVCGCMMEQAHVVDKIKKSYPFVALVFGTRSISDFPKLLFEFLSSSKRRLFLDDNELNKAIEENLPIRRDGKFKAWLPIMYGCDNFCSYCIVPYVRGRERSRDSANIIAEAKGLIERKYKEITLLGQNVNSYGKGNTGNGASFTELLKKLDEIPGEYWLRFMTSHPKDASTSMIDAIAESSHISKHLHLPLQSGSDKILKQMNRKYDRQKYLSIVEYAKNKIQNLSLTTDIIVGFPGETYEDFKQTLSLVEEVEYSSMFTFIYSPRKGTPASVMPDPISKEEKTEWFMELIELQNKIADKKFHQMINTTELSLIEKTAKKEGFLCARTSGNHTIEVQADKNLIGQFKNIKITEISPKGILRGVLVKDSND